MKILEKDIEKAILELLTFNGFLAWKNSTIGVYDSKMGSFRKPMGKFHLTGVSDIIAIKHGVVWFIEVKTPKGKMTNNQKIFQEMVENHGGNYLLARSIDDIMHIVN